MKRDAPSREKPSRGAGVRTARPSREGTLSSPAGDHLASALIASALIAENRRRGIDPDAWTAGARWKREADIPSRVLFQALEALEGGDP